MKACAPGLKSVSFELGGKNPLSCSPIAIATKRLLN